MNYLHNSKALSQHSINNEFMNLLQARIKFLTNNPQLLLTALIIEYKLNHCEDHRAAHRSFTRKIESFKKITS